MLAITHRLIHRTITFGPIIFPQAIAQSLQCQSAEFSSSSVKARYRGKLILNFASYRAARSVRLRTERPLNVTVHILRDCATKRDPECSPTSRPGQRRARPPGGPCQRARLRPASLPLPPRPLDRQDTRRIPQVPGDTPFLGGIPHGVFGLAAPMAE